MIIFRKKIYSFLSAGIGGMGGNSSFKEKKDATFKAFKTDLKRGDFGKALVHSIGASDNTINKVNNGTY